MAKMAKSGFPSDRAEWLAYVGEKWSMEEDAAIAVIDSVLEVPLHPPSPSEYVCARTRKSAWTPCASSWTQGRRVMIVRAPSTYSQTLREPIWHERVTA